MALQNLRLSTLKLFGRFPKTEDYEQHDKALREEYAEFLRFSESDEYKHFLSLKEFVESGEAERLKGELSQLRYQGSQEQVKEAEFFALKKNKTLNNYFRLKDSDKLNLFKAVELSGKPFRFEELQHLVSSPDYREHRRDHKQNKSDEYQKEIEYHTLRKDKELNQYLKLKRWKPIQDYFELEGSQTVERYYELETYIATSEFIERKAYLLSKNKFEQTQEYKSLVQYNELKKSSKILWFQKLLKSNKFDEVKRWKLSFSDDFQEAKLDAKVWLTKYFWGEALANKSYSLAGEKQAYSNGENIELGENSLKIVTRKQTTQGLSWDSRYGFVPNTFEYTSGIINTGQSFRQQYGRFEAKLRFNMVPNVYHAFWLVGDKMLPHIDIVRQNGSKKPKVQGSLFWNEGNKTRSVKPMRNGFNFNDNFFILGVDWTPGKMVWKINGIPYMETDKNLPNGPAYIVFSSGVTGVPDDNQLPAKFEIDWVKCWRDPQIEL
jgi:beta-glucanase (GH16 family)